MSQRPSTTPPPGETALRKTAPAWRLVVRAIGGPRALGGKALRIARTVRIVCSPRELPRRIRALQACGLVGAAPTRAQLLFGGFDMLRFVIEPAARDYYAQQGIRFGLHQTLRVLDDPVSMIDPTGLFSDRDTIIGHVMQVVHLNPVYDLQLLQMFPEGLEDLERQTAAMVAGTHPRARSIGAIVEDPAYHERLLEYVRRYRRDSDTPHLVRREQTLRSDPVFAAAERTFATLPGFSAYCEKLPTSLPDLARRLRQQPGFRLEDAEPEAAERG